MIRKVVITAAGIGTRLLTMTKEQPKEMMPLFTKNMKQPILIDGRRIYNQEEFSQKLTFAAIGFGH